ncbi:MAG: T9SS type A sorting domain-containing protein [Candidatus Kapabacteria bacterium]|nr:T9SS type A sorting domain-containing protein [Candidatus Kapabacteria bacterium]
MRVFTQTTTALASPQTPVRLQTTFRINANRFRGNAENPSASFYINGSLLIGAQNNGLRRIGGIYPELEGFIEGTEYWELTPQNSAWYKGAGVYYVEWVLAVDNDILNCRRIVRSAPLVLSIATTATTLVMCTTIATVETRLAGPSVITNLNTPIRFDGFFRMLASQFSSGGTNPQSYIHINGGNGLRGSAAYSANRLAYLGGTYPMNNGFLEATENMQVIAANSAWFRGAGTYTFEYSVVTDNDVSECRKVFRSNPVTITIATNATATMPSATTNNCTVLTTIATTLQSPSTITANTPIRYTGSFRINAEKFRSNGINPRANAYINGVPVLTFSPHGWRYISGEYPVRNGFLEATEFFEITPKGSAWFRGTGTYTIEYLLDLDTDDVNCSRQARSVPVSVRIEDTQITSNRVETKVYPNPASNELTVNIALSQTMPIECSIVDMLGRKQADICNGQYQSGVFRFTQPLSQFAQGTYTCIVVTPHETVRVPFHVIR